jgi:hypothetical protein
VVAGFLEGEELGAGAQRVGDSQAEQAGDTAGFAWGFPLEIAWVVDIYPFFVEIV